MTPPGSFRLACALLGGEPTVVVARGESVHRLADLLPQEAVPAQLHELLADWSRWQPVVTAAVAGSGDAPVVVPDAWEVPVRPSKLVCIGTNYRDHLREMGSPAEPVHPYSFLKPVSTGLVASGTEVRLPVGPTMVDWEAELALVIGSTPRPGADVLEAVAGYTVLNDLSARDWIDSKPAVGIDWVMMKGYDGFSPVGPWVTPREFVADPQALAVRCWVNGELKQDSSTSEMIFGVRAILEHLARIMTLEPGDVVSTGTPAGVGFGASPQQFLGPGDRVEVEVEGLGRLETTMVAASPGS